jgi:hypothetical protein
MLNSNVHRITPDDFNILNADSQFEQLKDLFKRYSAVLSVFYLFDITSLNGNVLQYKLNGYKNYKWVC